MWAIGRSNFFLLCFVLCCIAPVNGDLDAWVDGRSLTYLGHFSLSLLFFSIGHQSRFQQQVLLEEEDITLTFTGFQYLKSWQYLYYVACVLTGGIIFLLGRWMPQRLIAWIATPCEMSSAEAIVIEASMQFYPAKLPNVVPYLPPYFFFFGRFSCDHIKRNS